MSTNMLSPGVKATITDFSDYVSESSTSTIGIVGGARRGPITPTLVTNRAQALKIFGNPTPKDFGIYSLLAALENSNAVYYQRVVKPATKASAGNPDKDKLLFHGISESSTYNGTKIEVTGTSDNFTVKISLNEVNESYANCTIDNVKSKINGVSTLATVEVNTADNINFATGNFELSGGSSGAKFASTPESEDINFTSKYYDSTINGCSIVLTKKNFLNEFDFSIKDKSGNIIESLTQLSTDPTDDRYVESYINNNSAYVNCSYKSSTINDITDKSYELSGGSDGIDGLTASEIINGLDNFTSTESFDIDIICAPGWSDPAVINKGLSVCEDRQDSIFLIDPPFGLKAQQVNDWANCQGDYVRPDNSLYNSSYGAIYWPWVKVYESFSNSYIWLPPSGYVASQMAYSDKVGEPWFAPAGLNRGIMTTPVDIEYNPTKGERDLLYGSSNVVNPIISHKGQGLVIWGQKTTQRKSSALNRVNVRRLVNYLKRIITASTQYYVFEPNDEYCWERWVDMVEPRLESIQRRRGIYEFKIIMDSTTVTPDDIENNRMPGIIKFKPTKAAEFIPLEFQIMPYSANFNEPKL